MPSGLKRYYGDDHLHFLTWTCYHRQGWLAEPKRRDLLLHILEEARGRYRFVVVGYVVMPEHVHLLISEPEQGTPSTVVQVLKQRFARRVLRRKKRKSGQLKMWAGDDPHVWQTRFYDFNVWSERKRTEKLNYMHQNPVRRGLVQCPTLSQKARKDGPPGPQDKLCQLESAWESWNGSPSSARARVAK